MAASRYKKLPVTETGTYLNEQNGRLEFWFVVGDRRTKVGECAMNMTQSVKDAWERSTTQALRNMISRKVKDGTLRVAVPPVAGGR